MPIAAHLAIPSLAGIKHLERGGDRLSRLSFGCSRFGNLSRPTSRRERLYECLSSRAPRERSRRRRHNMARDQPLQINDHRLRRFQ